MKTIVLFYEVICTMSLLETSGTGFISHTIPHSTFRKFMSIRAQKVGELGDWTIDDTLKSPRQADGHSCGAFVMFVSVIDKFSLSDSQ